MWGSVGGFSSITGQDTIVNADNASFDGTERAGVIATDGQLWIGTTALNAGGTHINVGTLTSPDSSLTIGYSSPNITLEVTGGSTVGQTITGNSGGALSPTAGNWNIVTANSTVKFVGSGSTITQNFNIDNLSLGTSLPAITTGTFNAIYGRLSGTALTDGGVNSIFGNLSGNSMTSSTGVCIFGSFSGGAISGGSSGHCLFGQGCLASFTGGGLGVDDNLCFGNQGLSSLLTGVFNVSIGTSSVASGGGAAGSEYTSNESNNIVIQNGGVIGDQNTLRIGTQGSTNNRINRAFIAGIAGVANSNPSVTTVNTSTGQLGNDTTNFTILSTGLQLKGNNTNTAPPAGFIGQQIRGFASGVAITSTTPTTVTSIALTAGVWDITCILNYTISGGRAGYFITAITTTTNSIAGSVDGDTRATYTFNANSIIQWSHTIPAYRVLLNSTTTYYLVGQPSFSPGTCTATGRISAVRVG